MGWMIKCDRGTSGGQLCCADWLVGVVDPGLGRSGAGRLRVGIWNPVEDCRRGFCELFLRRVEWGGKVMPQQTFGRRDLPVGNIRSEFLDLLPTVLPHSAGLISIFLSLRTAPRTSDRTKQNLSCYLDAAEQRPFLPLCENQAQPNTRYGP